MELTSVLKFLENRTILVTGATGFLAKIFVEKILRVQPNVKKLYLLLRAQDNKAALQRFNTEMRYASDANVVRANLLHSFPFAAASSLFFYSLYRVTDSHSWPFQQFHNALF